MRAPSSPIWGNGMLELFTLWEISPRLQRGLEDRELGRVALTCRFAQDVLWVVSFIEGHCSADLLSSGE